MTGQPKVSKKKVTVFQVIKDGEVIEEYFDPVSARTKATEIVGRIQITAKYIEVNKEV